MSSCSDQSDLEEATTPTDRLVGVGYMGEDDFDDSDEMMMESSQTPIQYEYSKEPHPPALLPLVVATAVTSMCSLDIGAMISYPVTALPRLTSETNKDDIVLNATQAAFFGSVINLGSLLGSLMSLVPSVRLGQRDTMMITLPISLVAWLTLATTPTIFLALLARFVQGFAIAFMAVSCSSYIVELAHTSVRGRMMAAVDLARQLGILLGYGLGCTSLTWRQLALVFGFINTIAPFVGLLYLPSSPRWLMSRGRMHDAFKSLMFFRGRKYDIEAEMSDIQSQLDSEFIAHPKVSFQLRQLRQPFIFRTFMVFAFLMFILQFNGLSSTGVYITRIFNAASTKLDFEVSYVIIGTTRVLGTLTYMFMIDRSKRRLLLIFLCILCAIPLVLLGMYFMDKATGGHDLATQRWIPLASLAVFTFFSSMSYPLLALIVSELLPTSVRAVAMPTLFTCFFTGAFASSHAFPNMVLGLGEHGTFWLFGGVNLVIGILSAVLLPETYGQTLEEITQQQHETAKLKASLVSSKAVEALGLF